MAAIFTQEYMTEIGDYTGNNNVLSNKGFLRFLQEAAAGASDSVGYGPNDVKKTNFAWILLNWKIKVFSRPIWNKKITVKTWLRSFNRCYAYRDLEVYDENDKIIAIASSKWVLVSLLTGNVAKIPSEMAKKYSFFDKCVFDNPDFGKLKEPENSNISFEYIVQRRDIDPNNHVNNTNYMAYAYEALPQEVYNNMQFDNIEIMYKSEARLNDNICCYYSKSENSEHIVTIKNKESKVLHAIVKLY